MPHSQCAGRYAAILACVTAFLSGAPAQQRPEVPETVMVTLHARAGREADLERVIARHWATALRMGLVRDMRHVTIRGSEDTDKQYFVDIFTWRDARIPDTAPAEIREIWDEMNRLVESRGGRPGLEFAVVSLVAR